MDALLTLPSKVTVGYSRRQFVVRFGYSDQVQYHPRLEDAARALVTYYIDRKVTSVMPDLQSVISGVEAARNEVVKDLQEALVKAEARAVTVEEFRLALSRENHYRKLGKAPPPDHVSSVDRLLKK